MSYDKVLKINYSFLRNLYAPIRTIKDYNQK